VKYKSVAMKYPKAPSKNICKKSLGFGHLVSCDETFRTVNINTVATQNRASKVPTTLAPLS